MFEAFYEMTRTPFSRDMPTHELYASDVLEETLERLAYTAERQWFSVVTGDCGTGKTTTIRRCTRRIEIQIALSIRFEANATPFLQRIARTIGV